MNPERLFESDLHENEIKEILVFFGFQDWKQADQNLLTLIKMLGGDVFFLKSLIARIFGVLKSVSDPDRAFNNFLRFLENTPSCFMNFSFITHHPAITRILFRIFSDSQFFSDILIRHPDYFDWLLNSSLGILRNRQELLNEARLCLQPFKTKETRILALRRFQKREFLRIGTNDLLERASLEETTGELSHLADACIQCLYEIKKKEPQKEIEREEFDLSVISMGKMGGQELNYSSDIDLIFVGSGDLFQATRLASEICQDLTSFSEEGYFYRVDTRLRPEGDRGPLVQNIEGFQRYFENRARVWEKQAYLKARVSAGNNQLGQEFIELADGFIFKKYLTLEEINTIKRLKKSIEHKALQRHQWKREVKIGYGGIRDIEFFVQFIQLLYGGKYSQLKTANTLRALKIFYETGFVTYNEYHSLHQHYIFLRRVEHFLQIMDYQQTHLLPEKEEKRKILGIKMGHKTLASFESHYEKVTDEVRIIFRKYFEDAFEEQTEHLSEILMQAQSPEEIKTVLAEYGFEDAKRVFHILKNAGINVKNELRFYSMVEDIFARLKINAFNPEKGLVNLIRIIKAYRGEDVFFDIMKNSPRFLNTLVRIASFSDFMVEIIEKNPAVLDFLTEDLILSQPTRKKDLSQIIRYLREDMPLEQALKTLYEMEIFRIGTQDILGLKTLEEICRSLSILAETILMEALKEELLTQPVSFALIFLGKLAGREISYHSDLDMMLVCENSDYESAEKLTAVVHRVLERVKGVYEIDLRLRPNGKNSPLVISAEAFEKYLKDKGANWERLIYCRSRVYASSFSLQNRLKSAISQFIVSYPPHFKNDILEMREKISCHFPQKDFKKGSGGMIEIDFMMEYFKIVSGSESLSFFNLFKKMTQNPLHQFPQMEKLFEAFLFLRKLENSVRLLNHQYASFLPESAESQTLIAQKMGYPALTHFLDAYEKTRKHVEAAWDQFQFYKIEFLKKDYRYGKESV